MPLFVLCQDSNWHQTWSDPHFMSEWVSQCCPDGEGEIHVCLFAHSSSYFHLCPPISLFFYYSPVVLSYTSLLPFNLPFLSPLILPQNFYLKGLLSDNYKQCLCSHACGQARAHENHTCFLLSLSHSTAAVWRCECWTLLSSPLPQGIMLQYVPFTSRSG